MWQPRSATSSGKPRPPKHSKRALRRVSFRLPGRLMRVVGESMAPTLTAHQLVVVDERAYGRRSPRRGELVAVRPPALGGQAVVKRLIGLPYERVTRDAQTWQLGAQEFFLLGDHEARSVDSRRFGPVTRQALIGPVRLRLWPWRVFAQPTACDGRERPADPADPAERSAPASS